MLLKALFLICFINMKFKYYFKFKRVKYANLNIRFNKQKKELNLNDELNKKLRELLRNNKSKRSLDNNSDNAKFNNELNLNDDKNDSINLNNNKNKSIDLNISLNSQNLESKNPDNKNITNLKDKNSNNEQTELKYNNSQISKRDYDKEPLIIKNYNKFMDWGNFAFSTMFASLNILLFWFLFINKNTSITLFLLFLILLVCIVFLYLPYKYYATNSNYVVFYNNKIKFYKNSKLREEIFFQNKNYVKIIRPFWNYYIKDKKPIFIFYGFIIYLSFKTPLCLIYFLYLILETISYTLVKLLLHYNINKTFKNFNYFSSVYVADEIDKKIGFYLYFDTRNDYYKLKKYFLYSFNINIDYAKKDFFSMYK